MPQIAQQDYIIIKPAVAYSIKDDAAALGQMAAIMERKDTTIFDVLVDISGDREDLEKVVAAFRAQNRAEWTVLAFSADNSSANQWRPIYTSTQYEGLAAVQLAGAELDESYKDSIPELYIGADNLLLDRDNSYPIIDTEGHEIIATGSDGKLATVEISDVIYTEEAIKVPFEDIQKLIGLPIA